MDRAAVTGLLDHFWDILPSVRGVLLYGSHPKGYADERSDIDICLVLKEGVDRTPVYARILTVQEPFDVIIFDEIPWYLRGAILEDHTVLYADDPADLDYWLYKQRVIWADMKRRQMPVSHADLIRRVRS